MMIMRHQRSAMTPRTFAGRTGAVVLAVGLALAGPQATGVAGADGRGGTDGRSGTDTSASTHSDSAPAAPSRARRSPDRSGSPAAVDGTAAVDGKDRAAGRGRGRAVARNAPTGESAERPDVRPAATVPAPETRVREAGVGGHGALLTAPASAADIAPPQSSRVAAAVVSAAEPSGTATMTSPLAGPIDSPVPARPAGAATVAADPSDGLAGGVENFSATLSKLLGGLPGGQFKDLIAGAVLLARRQLFGESLESPSASGIAAGLSLPTPPIAEGMVRDLAVAATGAQQLTLSWKAPRPTTAGTPTGYTVIMETTPIDPSQDPGIQKVSTINESLTFAVNSTDKFVFSVAAEYNSGSGPARTVAYSATDSFLALTSFLSHSTAMLAASDGTMWISYQANLIDYLAKNALKCLGKPICSSFLIAIPGAHWVRKEYNALPSEVKDAIARVAQQPPPPPQVRQYKPVDGEWKLQTEILLEADVDGTARTLLPKALTEDTSGNIWVASQISGTNLVTKLLPNFGDNTGILQRISNRPLPGSDSGLWSVADTLSTEGRPMPQSLAASPDGSVWVGTDVTKSILSNLNPITRRSPNGYVEQFFADSGPRPVRTVLVNKAPVSVTVGTDGNLWFLETRRPGNKYSPTNYSVESILHRFDPVSGASSSTKVGRGGQGMIAVPGQDAVLVATHNGWFTYSQGGGQVKKVQNVGGKLKTVEEIDLDAKWFGASGASSTASQPTGIFSPVTNFLNKHPFVLQPDAGRPDSFTVAPDGSVWAAGRGAGGSVRSNGFAMFADFLLGPLGTVATKVIRYTWEIRSIVCEYKDCAHELPFKYPDFNGAPGFIAKVWTPERGLVAGAPVKFDPVPYRQEWGSAEPVAAPVSRGFWVDAGGSPLLIPTTPGTPVGLDATAGSGPEQVRLDWTPTAADGGTGVVTYTATVNTGLQRRTIPVDYYAYYGGMGLALSPDASRAYVADPNGFSVSLVDTASGAVTAVADLADPADVAVSPDGKTVYATNFFENSVSVLDAASGAVTGTVGGFDLPFAVAVSTLGDRFYVADLGSGVTVVDAATQKIITTIDVGTPAGEPTAGASNVVASPFSAQPVYAASHDGGFVSVISPVTNTVTNTLSLGGRPDGLAVSALGDYLYVASSMANEVWVFRNPSSSNPTMTTLSGFDGPSGVAVSHDGTRLYVTNSASGTVSVLSVGPAGSNTVIATLDVGANPKDVAVSPDSTRLFVVSESGLSEYVLPSTSQTVTIPAAPTSTTFDKLMCGPSGRCDLGTTYFTVAGTNFVGSGTDRNGNLTSAGLWLAADGTPLSTDHLGVGISRSGQTTHNGGFDTYGYAYSWEALGGSPSPITVSLAWDGATFDLGSPNQPDFTRFEGQTITVPVGEQASTLKLVGAAVNGNHPDVALTLNYSDGTSEAWTQSFSDWVDPQRYANETVISSQSYRYSQSGATDYTPTYVYGYSHPIAAGKQLVSITVPNNPYVRLLGIQ